MAALVPWLRPRRWALAWLALVGLAAGLAPALPLAFAPAVPDLAHVATPPLAGGHWLGTDPLGGDVLASLLFGARTALLLSLPAAGLATLLGALAGGSAGFWGNGGLRVPAAYGLLGGALAWWLLNLPWPGVGLVLLLLGTGGALVPVWFKGRPPTLPLPLDSLVLGGATLLGVVPRLVLVLALAAGTPPSRLSLLLVLGAASWGGAARLVRGQMLLVRELPFVVASQALGLAPARVWWRHALPHACRPLRTDFPLTVAALVGLESTLSFLGVGLPPETASWGRVLALARLEPEAWWLVAGPGSCLILTLLALQKLARA